MRKILGIAAAVGIALGVAGAAVALTGNQPLQYGDFGPISQRWLYALAGGLNDIYQSNITAAGTTQATATQLNPGFAQVEVDNVASGTGVALPGCVQGMRTSLYNNGANTVTLYPFIQNNPATGAQDTINAGTSTTIASHAALILFCPKTGNWAAH